MTTRVDGVPAARPRPQPVGDKIRDLLHAQGDWQALVVGFIVAWTVVEPYLAVRYGGLVAGAVLVTRLRYKPTLTDVVLLSYLAWSLLSMFWSAAPDQTWVAVQTQLSLTGLILGVRAVCTTRANVKVVSAGLLAGAVYALYRLWQIRDTASPLSSVGLEDSAIDAIGANRNYLAYGLATSCIVVVLLWAGARRRRVWMLVSPLVAAGGGVYFIGSRGALISVLLLAAWLLTWRFVPRIGLGLLSTGAAVGLLVLATGWLDDEITPTREAGRENGTLNSRLVIWPYARWLFSLKPVQGWGQGSFRELGPIGIVAHSAILEVAVGLGIIGVGLFMWLLWSILLHDTRTAAPNSRALVVGSAIVVTLPLFASGNWDQSGPCWAAAALVSCLHVWLGGMGGDRRRASGANATAEKLADPALRR